MEYITISVKDTSKFGATHIIDDIKKNECEIIVDGVNVLQDIKDLEKAIADQSDEAEQVHAGLQLKIKELKDEIKELVNKDCWEEGR